MKKCTNCKEVKELSEFGKNKSKNDGLQTECKDCRKRYREENAEYFKQKLNQWREENAERMKERMKKYRESLKDGYHHVYILPYHHYAGTTDCIITRMDQHKHFGRFTDNYFIDGSYENREDALEHERRLHDSGYNGRHVNNRYA